MTERRGVLRVLIVDDQILLREGLRKLLEVEEGIEVAGDATDGVAALDLLAGMDRHCLPDVVLVDARMPRMDGIALIARLREEHPALPALILTTFDDDKYIVGGFRAGARGYLLKDTPPEQLVSTIRRVADGETVLDGLAAERVVAALGRQDHDPGRVQDTRTAPVELGRSGTGGPSEHAGQTELSGLSEREREVCRLVGAGASNREIARTLFITEGTVKNHVTSVLRKLDLRDRTQLALWVNRGR
jgi:DNA-binding NarL/FixJ family response regulator